MRKLDTSIHVPPISPTHRKRQLAPSLVADAMGSVLTVLFVNDVLNVLAFLLQQIGHHNATNSCSDRNHFDLDITTCESAVTLVSRFENPTGRSSTVLRTRSGIVYVPSVCPILYPYLPPTS